MRHVVFSHLYVPAFFSWGVNSVQLTFIRSRRVIHRSACSWGGMVSHRFSISASVGFEMAWEVAARACTGRNADVAARAAELRRIEVRSIVKGGKSGSLGGTGWRGIPQGRVQRRSIERIDHVGGRRSVGVVMLEMLELWKGGWEAVLVESLFSRLSSVVTCKPSWPFWDRGREAAVYLIEDVFVCDWFVIICIVRGL